MSGHFYLEGQLSMRIGLFERDYFRVSVFQMLRPAPGRFAVRETRNITAMPNMVGRVVERPEYFESAHQAYDRALEMLEAHYAERKKKAETKIGKQANN